MSLLHVCRTPWAWLCHFLPHRFLDERCRRCGIVEHWT